MIYILAGPVHSGKTTFLAGMVRALSDKGIGVDGFLSVSVWDGADCVGYDLHDLASGKVSPLLRRTGEDTWQQVGPYFFIPQGLSKANNILLRTRRNRNVGLLVVDEVGPLELSGKGLWPALKDAISRPGTDCLLVVRDSILQDFVNVLSGLGLKASVLRIDDPATFSRMIDELAGRGGDT